MNEKLPSVVGPQYNVVHFINLTTIKR